MIYEERIYRSLINNANLVSYNAKIAESDLLISSDTNLTDEALKSLAKHRYSLETYIKNHPEFPSSLLPLPEDHLAPPIVRNMLLKSKKELIVSVYAGESPLSYKINFVIKPEKTPLGVCTSSATVGPSLSFGKADAVCVISKSATLADAAASAIGNKVKSKKDIKRALDFGIKIPGVTGIIIIIGNDMGAIGEVRFV